MIGNRILVGEQRLRVIDKILVGQERRKDMARGPENMNTGFVSVTKYICVDLETQEVCTITPIRIKKIL